MMYAVERGAGGVRIVPVPGSGYTLAEAFEAAKFAAGWKRELPKASLVTTVKGAP